MDDELRLPPAAVAILASMTSTGRFCGSSATIRTVAREALAHTCLLYAFFFVSCALVSYRCKWNSRRMAKGQRSLLSTNGG